MRRSSASRLLDQVEIELHVADLVAGELVEIGALAPEHVSISSWAQVFRIFEATPLDVEFDGHLVLDTDEIRQMEFLVDPVIPTVLPGIPEAHEFVLAFERALVGMDENDIRIVVPVEKLALVGRIIELVYVSFEFLLRHLRGCSPFSGC